MPSHRETTTNRYASIAAEIYDLDKPFGALPDTAFHLQRMVDVGGPILEPACGSGRTLVPLIEAGCDVAGFDPSPEMLDRCRHRCAAAGFSPDLRMQRFEDFHYDWKFAAVLVPVGSFTLIDDFATAVAVLRRFHAHLATGGLLVLDNQPLSFLAGTGEDHRTWTAPNGDLLTVEGRRVKADWFTQREERLVRYERWRDNTLVETQIEPMAQRYWGVEEFTFALAASGFRDIKVIGGYDRGRPPGRGDRVLTFEAVKIA